MWLVEVVMRLNIGLMADTTCELLWLDQLLCAFLITPTAPAKLYCDNKSALHIASNLVFHERTKHVENDCHVVRDQLKSGFLKTFHVDTQNQHADFSLSLWLLSLSLVEDVYLKPLSFFYVFEDLQWCSSSTFGSRLRLEGVYYV